MSAKLVFFDINGVLTPDITMAKLAGYVGKEKQAHALLKKHTSGEEEPKRVFLLLGRLLKGLSLQNVLDYSQKMPVSEGAEKTLRLLHSRGIGTSAITTGFKTNMHLLNERLGNRLCPIICNSLVYEMDGKILSEKQTLESLDERKNLGEIRATGEVLLNIMENKDKALLLGKILDSKKIKKKDCAAVGDSMGDYEMLKCVSEGGGTAVAYNPNKQLEQRAAEINAKKTKDLTKIIEFVS